MQRPTPGNWPATREYTRFLIDLRIVVRTSTKLYGRSKDLGEGGMGATVFGDLNIGEIVEVEFHPPETESPITIFAEVRYRQGFQYGFRFINPSDRQRAMVRQATRNLPMVI
ncbi:MAG TPA: PilZ domain-containing protein [Candidatus Angelobacter sp.]|nr:PilZ domain-containing protein [Candidatus Angelobacter sp.]